MDETPITSVPAETVQAPVEQVVEFPENGAVFGDEVVVHDVDENGVAVGWHKEVRAA